MNMGEPDNKTNDNQEGAKSRTYSYDSSHDTSEYARSLEKFYNLQEEGLNPPSLILAMTIGIDGLDHVLKSPPFSNLTSKSLQENYIPINDVLKKEILRRSHFLLKEIDNKKTDHPLRDNSMRLRMPQPAQWTREKRVKFLEEKNMLELHPLDVAFLKEKVEDIKVEVMHILGESEKIAKTPGPGQRGRRRSGAEAVATGDATRGKKRGNDDITAGGDATALLAGTDATSPPRVRGPYKRRQPKTAAKDEDMEQDDDADSPNLFCDSVAMQLYGAANGSTMLFGVSEEDATSTLAYLLNNRKEATSFLKVGQDFYKSSNLSSEETLEKSIHDLVRFCQRKRIKVEPKSPAPAVSTLTTASVASEAAV